MVTDPPVADSRRTDAGVARIYAAGERIDRYDVMGLLGRGGMAVVYAVRRRGVGDFERALALKMMLPHLVDDEASVAMFLDEIRIVSRIDHANVVRVLDVGEHDGSPFMVMELLRGRTLSACLRRGPPRPLVAAWLAEAAEGLHAAHETRDADGTWLRIVHRDVSAANVHVGLDGRARVLDFGIAGAVGRATATQHGELKGRLSMMAPEAITRTVPLDRRADVWSLGVMAWEALAGAPLFRGENEAETLWRVLKAPVPRLPDDVPDSVRAAISACIEREPGKRLPTTLELARTLRHYADDAGATTGALSSWMTRTFSELMAPEAERGPDTEPDAGPTRAEPRAPLLALDQISGRRSSRAAIAFAGAALVAIVVGAGAIAIAIGSAEEPRVVAPSPPAAIAAPAPAAPIEPVAPPDQASPVAEVEAPAKQPARRARARARAPENRRVEGRLLDSPYRSGD